MSALNTIEKQLADVFKGLPKLSNEARESLAKIWPWLALIGGVLQLLVAWGLYDLVRRLDRVSDVLNPYSLYLTGRAVSLSGTDKALIYLGILMLAIDAILMLMAYPELKKRTKRGWDLIFLAAVLNTIYAVVQLFTPDRGVLSFIGSLLGSFIAFYLLFQIRDKYTHAAKAR